MNRNTSLVSYSHSGVNWREEMQFYRKKRNQEIRKEKVKKSIMLKTGTLLIIIVLVGLIFYLIRTGYLFLISWDKLNVQELEIYVSDAKLKRDLERELEKIVGRNILLINSHELKQVLIKNKRIREVQIKKVLPSTMIINVELRQPFAILKDQRGLYLIDEEGFKIRDIKEVSALSMPVIILRQKEQKEKIEMILSCLKEIDINSIFNKISSLEFISFNKLSLRLKNDPTQIILSPKNFSSRLKFYFTILPKLKQTFGNLEYIDLRFKDRIYVKPVKSVKEENNG